MPITPGLCAACGGGGSGSGAIDTEPLVLCDINPATGEVVGSAIAVYQYDDAGLPVGPPTFVIPGTNNPYVVQFSLQPCDSEGQSAVVELCDVQADQSSVQFVRHYIFGPTGNVLSSHDSLADGSIYVPTGTVQDCDPFTLCTPDSNIDLNANCGPGQSPVQQIINDAPGAPLANAVFVDDATADPLCGGTWDRPASALPVGFPVEESFRNTTFDDPGPSIGGSPTPFLTAGPPVNDGNGAGWFREADTSGGSNGFWQVATAFPTNQGMNAAISWASHDGTIPGGDGQYFVFTDGTAPLQANPIGGFGNLGLQNWQGGVFAIVLDEYGQTCTCSHAVPPIIDPNPGPCGFCSNSISIQLAGASRVAATCACCTIAQMPLNPKALNQTTRSQPVRLLTSVVTEAGQTYVSASLDWNDGNGPIQYFNRVNITACVTVPATLRMAAYSGSGGAFQAIKEIRDAIARPAGVSNWRAFPITTDPIVCPGLGTVSLVNIEASVDVTPNDDGSQTTGNGNPELYFWLVNTATNTIVDSDQISIIPSQLGNLQTMTVSASVPPADVPNLRLYVGAESRDDTGEYDSTWENLTVSATAAGCPATPRRTMEISARCPIPVTIVGGGTDDGGGGGTTVVNTPSTFEDAAVCATVAGVQGSAFRREIHLADGTIDVTFIGTNGLPITPTAWTAGPCPPVSGLVLGEICYDIPTTGPNFRGGTGSLGASGVVANPYSATYLNYLGSGVDVTITSTIAGGAISATQTQFNPNGVIPVTFTFSQPVALNAVTFGELDGPNNQEFVGGFSHPVTGLSGFMVAGGGPGEYTSTVLNGNPDGDVQFGGVNTNSLTYNMRGPGLGQWLMGLDFNTLVAGAVGHAAVVRCDGCDDGTVVYVDLATGDPVVNPTIVTCSAATIEVDQTLGPVCYTDGILPISQTGFLTLDQNDNPVLYSGTGAVVTGATIVICPETTIQGEILCDAGNANHQFLRWYLESPITGVSSTVYNFELDGSTPYVPVGPVGLCDASSTNGLDVEVEQLCDNAGVRFLRKYVYNADTGVFASITDTTLDGSTPFAPVLPLGTCDASRDSELEVLCDSNGTVFLRKYVYDGEDALFVGILNTTLDGNTPFVPVGAVGVCPVSVAIAQFDVEQQILCDSAAVPVKFLRRYVYDAETPGAGITIVNTTLDGTTPFVPTGAVQVCPQTVTTDLDFVVIELCDNNGGFLRRFTFNSTTGAVTATTNTDLNGAAYVPVGTVGICDGCCPIEIGQGCTNVGSLRYTALRLANGTISLIDSVTGAAVLAANIVTCASDDVVKTLTAQARQVTNATPWTPGADVVGTLTSLSVTGTSGLWDMVDQNGTVLTGLPAGLTLTWSALDDNTLSGPTSVTPQLGSSVVANWTQR